MFESIKSKANAVGKYVVSQLEQASTWRAIVFFVMYLLGKSVADLPSEAVLTFSTGAAYVVGLIFPDKPATKTVETSVVVVPTVVVPDVKEASNGLSNPS